MNTITFKNVVPQVFAARKHESSELWRQEVSFERGHTYLVEADSGQGKSTFCSYVIGYRNDYTGQILFDDQDVSSFKASNWADIRKHRVSCLFQELRLFPELTALENVEIKNKLTGWKTTMEITAWFEQLGIGD